MKAWTAAVAVAAAIAGCAAASVSAEPHDPPPVSPLSPTGKAMRMMHMYGGEDGESHMEIIDLPLTGGGDGRSVQSRLRATDVEIGDTLPGGFIDWHGVSTPRFLIVLSGQLEVGLGDGSKHVLSKGDIVLADDVTGRGHTSRMIGTEPVRILTVRLPRESALTPKAESCPDGMAADQCVAARLQGEARKGK